MLSCELCLRKACSCCTVGKTGIWVNNMAEFHLAAPVSGSCCACWSWLTETCQRNGAFINIINTTRVFPIITSQNVCCKKRPASHAKSKCLHWKTLDCHLCGGENICKDLNFSFKLSFSGLHTTTCSLCAQLGATLWKPLKETLQKYGLLCSIPFQKTFKRHCTEMATSGNMNPLPVSGKLLHMSLMQEWEDFTSVGSGHKRQSHKDNCS